MKKKQQYKIYVITTLNKPHNKFIYMHVLHYYQENGKLHIIEQGSKWERVDHVHQLSVVEKIMVHKYVEGKIY